MVHMLMIPNFAECLLFSLVLDVCPLVSFASADRYLGKRVCFCAGSARVCPPLHAIPSFRLLLL